MGERRDSDDGLGDGGGGCVSECVQMYQWFNRDKYK